MLIKFKLEHSDAKLPTQAHGDVGFDIFSCEDMTIIEGRVQKVKTGVRIAGYDPTLAVNIRDKNVGLSNAFITVYPKIEGRSSLASNGIFTVAGIIDPVYRGELTVVLANMSGKDYEIKKGDRIAQLIFYPCLTLPEIKFEIVDEVSQTARGEKGFGSTGK